MMRRALSDERGAVYVIVVLSLPALLLMAAFVIETGNWWTHKRHLQNQVDAGALAAGASYALPQCESDTAKADAIADEALGYAGTPRRITTGATNPTYNFQLSNAGNVHVTINSSTYWDGPSSGPPPDYSDGGHPCFNRTGSTADRGMWTDVKATELDPPSILPFAGSFVNRIRAHARVAIKKATIFTGALPFAVPDVRPSLVRAFVVDECRGNAPVGPTISLSRIAPVGGLDTWRGTSPSAIAFPGATGSTGCTLTDGRNGRVGVRILLSYGSNDECGEPLVDCYAADGTGFWATRVWTAGPDPGAWVSGNPTTTFLPYVKDVDLDSNPACFAYFAEAACSASIVANVERGTDADPANPTSFATGTLSVTINAGAASGGPTLYSRTVPLVAGANPITMLSWSWQKTTGTWRGLLCETGRRNPCRASGDWGTVHRAFVAANNATAGPIRALQVRDSFNNLLENVQEGTFTDTVTVQVGLTGSLEPASSASSPIVNLKTSDESQTRVVDCDQGRTFTQEIAEGCTPFFELNDGTDPDWNPCPTWSGGFDEATHPQPWQCVTTETGVGRIGQLGQGLSQRLGNTATCVNDNNWSNYGDGSSLDPLRNGNDPRRVKLYIVSFDAFTGSGNDEFPVLNVGNFYITGFGSNGAGRDRCAPPDGNGDVAEQGDILGHFMQYVPFDEDLIPSDDPCAPNTITPCVAVLVD